MNKVLPLPLLDSINFGYFFSNAFRTLELRTFWSTITDIDVSIRWKGVRSMNRPIRMETGVMHCLLINNDSRKNCVCEEYVIYKWVNYHCQSLFGFIHQRQSLCFAWVLLFFFFFSFSFISRFGLFFLCFSPFYLFSISLSFKANWRTHKLFHTYPMRKMNSITIISAVFLQHRLPIPISLSIDIDLMFCP